MADSAQTPTEDPIIAFFDVDNTLMRGASVYHVGRGAFRRRLIKVRDILLFAWHDFRFVKVGENREHLATAKDRALQLVAGHTEKDLNDLAEDVYERDIERRLWPETVDLTQEHLGKGHEVWLVSATPDLIGKVIAQRLGLTGALGTKVEAVDGVFTGRIVGQVLHADYKAEVVKAFADERGANLEDCWAYSDSRNDIPLLSLVGNPVVVNPDAVLARHAREYGWTIIPLKHSSIRGAQRKVRREAKAVRKAMRK